MSDIQQKLKEKLSSDDIDERRQAAEEFMYNPQDDEAIRLLAKLVEDADKGIRNAAAMALKFSPNKKLAAEYLTPLIASTDISIRNLSGDILINCGSDAIEPLSKYLPEADNDGIKFIIDLFSLIKDPAPAPLIKQVLKSNSDENVILACIEALGNLGVEDSYEDLITAYWMNDYYKPTVVEALGKIGSPKVLEFLHENYEEADELTQFSIAESLGLIGDASTFFFLISKLSSQGEAINWVIIDSIYKLKEKFGFDVPFDETVKNVIIDTIENGDFSYKHSAVNLISEFSDKGIIFACLKVYGIDSYLDFVLKEKLITDTSLIYPYFSRLLDNPDYNPKGLLSLLQELLENDADSNIGKLEDFELRNLCDEITKYLNDPDEEIRKISMELLFAIQPETAFLFIDSMVNDTNMWNRMRLIELLQSSNYSEAEPYFRMLTVDPEEMVSFQANEALENLFDTNTNN